MECYGAVPPQLPQARKFGGLEAKAVRKAVEGQISSLIVRRGGKVDVDWSDVERTTGLSQAHCKEALLAAEEGGGDCVDEALER